jgi:hypothetical protein
MSKCGTETKLKIPSGFTKCKNVDLQRGKDESAVMVILKITANKDVTT